MALKIRRFICDYSVCDSMTFSKSIFCELDHHIENLVRFFLGDSVIDCAAGKAYTLLLHNVDFFLSHCSANNIRPAIRVTGNFAAYLHYLLLVYYTAVGFGQYFPQFGDNVVCFIGVFAVLQELFYRLHRSGTVQRDCRNYILELKRFHPHKKIPHTVAFKLKQTERIPGGKHIICLRIVERYFFRIEIRFAHCD